MKSIIVFLVTIFLFFGCSTKNIQVLKYQQNTNYLVNQIKPLSANMQSFDSRYFMPWNIKSLSLKKKKAAWANYIFDKKGKYYAQNMLPWKQKSIRKIINSTNFSSYDQEKLYAITTKNVQVRNLPTHKPFMLNPKLAGEGFAFDYMQNTRLHVNTPVFISHYNKDGSWAFIQNPVSLGWIPVDDLRILDLEQMHAVENSKKLIIIKDKTPVYSNKQRFLLYANLGAIFPYLKEDKEFYYSYVFTRFKGKIKVRILKDNIAKMPLKFNRCNVLRITHELLGEKYGWGGFMNDRDCSAMTKDYFAVFGLWLPRNSAAQKNSGVYISLNGLSDKKKEQMILKNAIAFESLLYLKGHIMLYVGKYKGKAIVMQNLWGIRTVNGDTDGRYIIGKTIISDLFLGQNLSNLKKGSLLISRILGIVIKPDVTALHLKNNSVFFKQSN